MDSKIFREAALAYQAVYDEELRQEIEEQQDFENWVNSLVEEGYDLSEYTWEEMYEAYLDEAVRPSRGGAADPYGASGGAAGSKPTPYIPAALSSLGRAMFGGGSARPSRGGAADPYGASGAARPAARPAPAPAARPSGGSRPAPAAPAARPSGGSRPAPAAPAARPSGGSSAPAARPAASAPTAKPSPTPSAAAPAKPTPAPSTPAAKPSAMDQWAKANPRLAQAQQIRKQGGSRAEVNKALYNKGTAAATSTPTVVKAGFDLFDVVKGYLIDEGFAETEQAAIAIMANMSEGWKFEIINKVND